MIYQKQDLYENQRTKMQMKRDGQIILCLPGLDYVQDSFQRRVDILNQHHQTKTTVEQLRNKFQDTILTTLALNTKIQVLILPFDSFYRQFQSAGDQREVKKKCTPFGFIQQLYGNMRIGVSVPWNQVDHFIKQYKQNPQYKHVKIINFNLQSQTLKERLPLMRKVVQQTFNQKVPYKIQYHINLYMKLFSYNTKKQQMKWGHQLDVLRGQLLLNNYPIQYMSISNVLPNLPVLKENQVVQYYSQLCRKYFPVGLASINQTFYSNLDGVKLSEQDLKQDLQLKEIFTFYRLASKLNQNMATVNPTLKNGFSSGIRVPQCLLVYALKSFEYTQDDAFHLRSLLDGYGYTQINLAAQGLFKEN